MRVRYKTKRKKNKKQNRLIILIVIVIIIILLALVHPWKKNTIETAENKVYLSASDFKTIKEVLEYYGNEYQSEKEQKDDKYTKVVYAKLNTSLFDGDKSNEIYYQNLIGIIAKVNNFNSYKIVDNENNIEIKVECNDSKVTKIFINGDSNYFEHTLTNMYLSNKEEIETNNVNIESPILKTLINNNWVANAVNFGTKESIYDKYDIYFDEGMEVRIIAGKVYNIVFTKNYQDNIINTINTSTDEESIKNILGTPTFENDLDWFGYKLNDIYLFFNNGEISVYRVENDYDTQELIELIKNFNKTHDAKELGNSLTDLWNDYDEYNYDTNYVELTYSLKGFKMQFNVGNPNGFIVYNNYTGCINSNNEKLSDIESVDKLLTNMHYKNEDLVWNTEIKRAWSEYTKYNYEGNYNSIMESNSFRCLCEVNEDNYSKVRFVSITKEYADSQLDENLVINNFLWKDDYNFIYSIKNDGIYVYDCLNKKNKALINGNQEFILKEIENDILKYDNNEISLKQ